MEFSQQLEDFQKAVPDLTKSIQDSVATIDNVTDVDKARAEIDGLRATVSTLLNAISDNGPVSQLGVKALDHVHNKLKELSQSQRFKPQERQFLIERWHQVQDQTERATKELDAAREHNSRACCRLCRRTRTSSPNFWKSDRRRRRSMRSVASLATFAMYQPSSTS